MGYRIGVTRTVLNVDVFDESTVNAIVVKRMIKKQRVTGTRYTVPPCLTGRAAGDEDGRARAGSAPPGLEVAKSCSGRVLNDMHGQAFRFWYEGFRPVAA